MDFRDIQIKPEYRSLSDNMIKDFYVPLLSRAKLYKRAVGFFSSSALIEISKGITHLVENGGKILLVASPYLSEKDIESMDKGFKLRSQIVEQSLVDSITPPKDLYEEKRLSLLAYLIAEEILDIKIALTSSKSNVGMFHEKMGLLYDGNDNIVAFSGSMNESSTAFSYNYESIDVFCSWTPDQNRVKSKEDTFEAIWNNYEPNIDIIEFPKVAKEIIMKYQKDGFDLVEFNKECPDETGDIVLEKQSDYDGVAIPRNVKLHDYQLEAIDQWEKSNYIGIFDMATGTGKTYTGLGAVVRLYEKLNKNLAVFIVCPFQHLVEQWVEDIEAFGMSPIIGYSTSRQRDWKQRLKNAIMLFRLNKDAHFSFVCTNATFSSEYVQKQLEKLKGNVLLIVDEAHNFGADHLSRTLNPNIPYRLALSATLERHRDEEGTQKLFDYFGEKNIEYSLERAILEDKLTPYYYYPIVTHLTPDELAKYKELTVKIGKSYRVKNDGSKGLTKSAEILLIERARIIAGAVEKLDILKELMLGYKDDNNILVYCGATTIKDSTYQEGVVESDEERQIDAVTKILGLELGMRVSQFTSRENSQEREVLKKEFAEGESIQALIAIRCLDEGVNIPSIQTAFILASSTNPKEYVQRRGRVLRKAPGKNVAKIYDFITLPRPLEDVYSLYDDDLKQDISLIKREIERMVDFASIAENSSIADELISDLEDAYNLNKIGGSECEF